MAVPEGLGKTGSALWAALQQVEGTPSGVLALEACRAADRLDELDSVIQGKGVLQLMQFRVLSDHISDGAQEINVEVSFSNVLAEARQQQMALKQILTSLGVEKGAKPEPERKGSPLDELANRRSGRGAKPAGARRATGVRK